MPRQSTRGIYEPYPTFKPEASGVRKVSIGPRVASGNKTLWRDTYLYYSKSDNRWYTANGACMTKWVHGFYSLSR